MYDVIDHTSDEAYYPVGAFESVDEAIAAIDGRFEEYGQPVKSEFNFEDYSVRLVIRKLTNGFGEPRDVWERTYAAKWEDEDTDDPTWTITETKDMRVSFDVA